MCHVTVIRESKPLTLFEIHFDGDEVEYRVWADNEKHAEEQARGIANYFAWMEDPLKTHKLPK